jgi:hypothetical protein
LYVGDAGATEPNRATARHGMELGVYVTPRSWLTFDADLAWSHGRFSKHDPAARAFVTSERRHSSRTIRYVRIRRHS